MKVGDKVRVVKVVCKDGIGWACGMNAFIGKEFVIKTQSLKNVFKLKGDKLGYDFPIESLELIEETFEEGEPVEVSDGNDIWYSQFFLFKDKRGGFWGTEIRDDDEADKYKYCRKPQVPEVTQEELIKTYKEVKGLKEIKVV